MAMNTKSIRSKLLGLLAGIALAVTLTAVLYDLLTGQTMLRDQIAKRGRYISSNLAFNAKYGVLTEDKPLLLQFLDGAVNAGGTQAESDVVGALIRDAKGQTLAQTGRNLRDLPREAPTALEEREALTSDGERVLLFRAPVTSATAAVGEDAAAGGARAESVKGGVEVAISQVALETLRRRRGIEALLLGLVLAAVGSATGWALAGRWLQPLQSMALASESVAKGDLTVNI